MLLIGLRFLLLPITFVIGLLFNVVIVNLYKLYLRLKIRFGAVWRPAKNKLLFPLSTKYVIHAVLIILTLFVGTNSLKARELRQEEFSKPALLSALFQNGEDREIVETADAVFTRGTHYAGIGGVSQLDVVQPVLFDTTLAAAEDNSSLINPQFASTTVTLRDREDVEYHTVEGGETISTIAQNFGVSVNTLLWENELSANSLIKPGQKLTILPTTGIAHRVASGESVASIAKKYSGDVDKIVDFNKLASADAVTVGQVLMVPGGKPPEPPKPVVTTRLASAGGSGSTYSADAPAGSNARSSGFIWPTESHRINQGYHYGHTGIDIDGEYSSHIYAVAAGRVKVAGWGGGYGLHIVINHGNGVETLYGHSSKLFVKTGDYVSQGQALGMQGCTGWCTGVHLHFEVNINGKHQNPFNYL